MVDEASSSPPEVKIISVPGRSEGGSESAKDIAVMVVKGGELALIHSGLSGRNRLSERREMPCQRSSHKHVVPDGDRIR